MKLVVVSQNEKVASVSCAGDICESLFPTGVSNPLEHALGENCYHLSVIMDLGEATLIDSSGVCWIMGCHKRFLAAGGKLILHSVPPMIDQILRLLQLHTILTMKSDRATALALAEQA